MSTRINYEAAPTERSFLWKPIATGMASLALVGAGIASLENLSEADAATSPQIESIGSESTTKNVFASSTSVIPHVHAESSTKQVQPRAWKYGFSRPSHGPLPHKLQTELNSITPRMYRTMLSIGNSCEGRRGKWQRDNGTYGGGLNITDTNWSSRQFGGRDFAPKAEKATPAEQMDVLMRIQVSYHWGVPNWCPLAQYGPWKDQYRIFKHR